MSWVQEWTRALVWSLIILTVWSFVSIAAVDQTLEEKASGKDVVEAVVSKIRQSGVFTDDYQFLRRIAYAETKDGVLNTTYANNKIGGIWSVAEVYFKATQNVTMTSFHAKIITAFKIDWTRVLWKDTLKPLYSGIAARLYLAYLGMAIPQTVEEQANYYDRYYTRKDNYNNKTFINSTDELGNTTTPCSGKMDLVVVLDGSSSINEARQTNFDICKNFVVDLIGSYSIKSVRHGLIVFSSEIFPIFPLDNFLTMDQLKSKTLNAPYPDAKTNTNQAILAALTMFSEAEIRPGVPQVMTILTDGRSNPAGVENIALTKAANISSYVIGITKEVVLSELETLAYNIPANVYALDNFEVLADFFQRLKEETCKVPQKPKVGEPLSDSLVEGEKRYYEYEFSSDGALMLEIKVSQGETKGYYSFSEVNPSSAVNDGALKPQGTLIQPRLSNFYTNAVNSGDIKVYISVEGVKADNEYVIEGQASPRDDSTTEYTSPESTSSTESESASTDTTDTTEKISSTTNIGTLFTVSFSTVLMVVLLVVIA